jgi:hypothetical protein
MLHLNFNQEFCFTTCVSKLEADSILSALNSAKFMVQHKVNKDAPAMVDITVLCQKGMNDAFKAVSIINA